VGRRGPLGMDAEKRAALGGRDRTKPFVVPDAVRKAWSTRADQLERAGMKMISGAAKKPTSKSAANGLVVNAKIAAGLKLLEAADKLWSRLARLGPSDGPAPGDKPKGPPPLSKFREQRTPQQQA
jgi:hypothetical protein